MSGPIVRRYGFPNFEKIFGNRDLQHGTEENEAAETTKPAEAPSAPEAAKPAHPQPNDKK